VRPFSATASRSSAPPPRGRGSAHRSSRCCVDGQGRRRRFIKRLDLEAGRNQQALAAAELFAARNLRRLTDTDRPVLLAQLGGLLNDEQRDDLRAALERRPLVKQQQLQPAAVSVELSVMLDAPSCDRCRECAE
jgi:hypothetical protein